MPRLSLHCLLSVFSAGLLGAPAACSQSAGLAPPATTTGPDASATATLGRYGGQGFVVHEWGTNTLVVGSNGSLQRGLHHEEEDLPAFVYDRVKAGGLQGSPSVELKMETPITYFYSDKPLSAKVSIGFPMGVFTQWYPAVAGFLPVVAVAPTTQKVGDPVLDVNFPITSDLCRQKYATLAQGALDWNGIQVLARGTDVSTALQDAPLDRYTWGYARGVASNPVQMSGVAGVAAAQTERFLFYRGLGNFPIPVQVTTSANGDLAVQNLDPAQRVGAVFVISVGPSGGAFRAHSEGIAAGGMLSDSLQPLLSGGPIDRYGQDLAAAVTAALDGTGLYHDEALAMVNTWRRQWFTTPGVRVLYLAPQAWTDQQIPLSLQPAPDALLRVMVIRTELIMPQQEQVDAQQAAALPDPSAAAYFQALGRFAEPRLRRALQVLGATPPAAAAYLAKIATASTNLASGE